MRVYVSFELSFAGERGRALLLITQGPNLDPSCQHCQTGVVGVRWVDGRDAVEVVGTCVSGADGARGAVSATTCLLPDLAHRLAEGTKESGTHVVGEEGTAGRGRAGHAV